MGDKGTIELTEEGARLLPYNPVEDYEYPLESWPKDTKDRFVAEHKDDPLADVGTAAQQPKREPVSIYASREKARKTTSRICLSASAAASSRVENVEFGCGTAVACHMANASYLRRVLVVPAHELMQGEGDFVGMRCAPGNDALELEGIVGDGADFHQLGFNDLRVSHSNSSMAHAWYSPRCWLSRPRPLRSC
jgi:hypothetical protein